MLEKIKNKDVKITIIGMGYIGLPTSIVFSKAGFKVLGFDVNEKIIEILKNGKIHIVEPDLQDAFKSSLDAGLLIPTNKITESDIFIICVPTPFKHDEKEKIADLDYVVSASKKVAEVLKKGDLVILESTVPPKTTEEIMGKVLEEKTGLKINDDFYVAHCPERVLPGKILYEMEHNNRVIGASNEYAMAITKELYSYIVKEGNIYTTDTVTAEMCKLVENTFRDVNIAFANELSVISDKLGINVYELIELANKHPRVNILQPGIGVGGHCLAVDPWFITEIFPEDAKIIRASREMNDYKPHYIVKKIEEDLNEKFFGKEKKISIGILGLAYKADIDDLRESPAMEIAMDLKEKGYNIEACEPYCKDKEINGMKNKIFDEIIKNDYLILAVGHKEFKNMKEILKDKKIFKGINL